MPKEIENFRRYRQKMNQRLLSKENEADIIKRVYALDTYSYQNKNWGLTTKIKEMLGLVSSMVLRCDDCVKYHLEKCFELSCAKDEIMDIFGIANVVGGSIVIPHTRRALEYWELLEMQRPDPNPFSLQIKQQYYTEALAELESLFDQIEHSISRMSTMIEVLKNKIPYFYWVGFYLFDGEKLVIGPYQGTHGCIRINLGVGVCGRAAAQRKTIIVDDIQAINEQKTPKGEAMHITCDPRCKSEIVIPILKNQKLLGVFDVDSRIKNSFNHIDQKFLEKIIDRLDVLTIH